MNEIPNIKYIKKLASGSRDFEQKLILILKREFPEEKKEFLENYSSEQYAKAAENVHKLKHKVGMLGFEDGYQLSIDFEEALLNKETSLFSEYMLILDSIEYYLKTL